jgi:hypothetical protein
MEINGTFTSVWDNATITTPAVLDTKTGEVIAESIKADNLGTLREEWFEDQEGEEFDVCPECHEYITKVVYEEGVGKTLYEKIVCRNPDCENK